MSALRVPATLSEASYSRTSPYSAPFEEAGDVIGASGVTNLVEVMKHVQEIAVDVRGPLVRFVRENGAVMMVGKVIAEIDA